uniref:TRIM8/14/16/25/29/45/65 coiled-coil region domain-containing protein n=1 Tax=Salmo trutta TaxID=8032 RepID=A0A674AF46_SALTR
PLSLCLSLCLSVPLSLWPSVSLSLSVPLSLSLSLCPSLCVPLSVSLGVPLSVSPSLWVSVSPSLGVSLSLFLCLSLSVPLSLSLCVSLSLSLSLSVSLSLCLSLSLSVSVSLSPSLSLSLSLSLTVSLSLQSYQSLSSISVSSDLPSIVVRPLQYFGDVSKTVSELREKLEDFLKGEWTKISTTVNIVEVVLPPEPKTREQLLQLSLISSALIDVFSVTWSCMENGPGTKGQFRTSQPTTSWYHLLSTKLYELVSQTQINPSPGLKSVFNVDVQETVPKCVIFHPPILLSPATLNVSSRWCY